MSTIENQENQETMLLENSIGFISDVANNPSLIDKLTKIAKRLFSPNTVNVNDSRYKTLETRLNTLAEREDQIIESVADITQIKETMKTIEGLPEKMESLAGELKEVKSTVTDIKSDRERKKRIRSLQDKIKSTGFKINKVYQNVSNSAITSMIVEGCDKASLLFSGILFKVLEGNIDSIDCDQVKDEALMYLRSIRSQYGGGISVDKHVSKKIRDEIAYGMVLELISDLELLKEYSYEDDVATKFEKMALEFTGDFIKRTFELIRATHDIK